jgi:tetratricopeptide (TPR) repeat protein
VLGTTLDVALRLQAAAAPGTVVISAATRSLVQRGFPTEALAPLPPSAGAIEPLVPYRVREGSDLGEADAFDVVPLVGRVGELDQLMNRWEQARAGNGQAVLLSGEPGIGKSRLLRALRERVRESSGEGTVSWLSIHGSPYTQNTPLHPVVDLLQRTLASQPDGSALEQLDAVLRSFSLEEALPLFAALLDLPLPTRPRVPSMPPERQREETLEALVALVLEMAEREPAILLIEDLHWLDATTLAWLERLIDQTAAAHLLLVMTIRPDTLDIPWGSRARVTQIALGALNSQETERLIRLLSGDQPLRPHVQQHIVAKTDGVPLFVEELTRSVLEGGDSGEWRELPTTLRDSLTARLGRLGTAKEVAQLASVIGREFSLTLLAAVASHNVDTLERELRRLVQSGLVHRRGFGVHTRYSFKHALIRDAAYDSLLRRERQQIHLRVATAMDEENRGGGKGALSEEIAHHYMAGEQYERAFTCLLEAGQLAIGRSAHAEAIGHFQHALHALEAQPPSQDRDRREISLRSVLAVSLGVIRGQSAPEVEAVYERILNLTGQIGNVPNEIYFGLWNFYASRGKLLQARDLGQQRLAYGEASGESEPQFLGLYTSAAADLFLGHPQRARQGFERLLATYPREGLANQAIAYDIGIVARSLLGDALWLLGQPDTATQKADEAIELGRRFSPFTQSVALVNRMILATSMRDGATSRQRAQELIALSAEHSYQYWTVHWRISLALTGIGPTSSPAEIDQALQDAASTIEMMRTAYGSNLQCSRFLAWTVAACLEHGRKELARPLLEQALHLTEHDEEHFWEADLRRLQALLLRAEGADVEQVEICLQKSLAVARAQGGRILELRAAVDLSRLWRDQGRSDEARALLSPLYGSFTEGWESPDLKAAGALLALPG